MTLDACGASRLLLAGFVAGTLVSSLTGSDLAGWAAAALAVGLITVLRRVRGTSTSCPIPPAVRSPVPGTELDVDDIGRRIDQPMAELGDRPERLRWPRLEVQEAHTVEGEACRSDADTTS